MYDNFCKYYCVLSVSVGLYRIYGIYSKIRSASLLEVCSKIWVCLIWSQVWQSNVYNTTGYIFNCNSCLTLQIHFFCDEWPMRYKSVCAFALCAISYHFITYGLTFSSPFFHSQLLYVFRYLEDLGCPLPYPRSNSSPRESNLLQYQVNNWTRDCHWVTISAFIKTIFITAQM